MDTLALAWQPHGHQAPVGCTLCSHVTRWWEGASGKGRRAGPSPITQHCLQSASRWVGLGGA